MRVAVIGAGPGGLVTLKYLLQAQQYFGVDPIDVRLFEAEDGIGGTFRYRTYPEGEMVSSKQLTLFSDFRIPPGTPGIGDFLPLPRYVQYLEEYCDHFNLRPHIYLSSRVSNVRRQKGGAGHIITYTTKDGSSTEWYCDAVAVCSGLHVTPGLPDIPGLDRVPTVFHSSQYKGRQQFGEDKNIVILGVGETSMDIAYFAVTSPTKSVTICHRDGFVLAPKHVPNFLVMGKPETRADKVPPIDVTWASLFDTAYCHPRMRESPVMWQWQFYDLWTKFCWILVNGSRYGYGEHVGIKRDLALKKVIFVKSTKAVHYFNKQYVQDNWAQRLRRKVIDFIPYDTKGRVIDVAPFPEYIDEEGVIHWQKNDRPESIYMQKKKVKPDVVICATGYQHLEFPFLSEGYPHSNEADIRAVWKDGDPTVGFIGFVRPQIGAIPPLAEFQAQLWVMKILNQVKKPLQPLEWYKLFPDPEARIHHGVDHDSYAYQLALDMGSAPSITDIVPRGWKMTLTWAMSANVNTKFRIVGPWKWEGADEVMTGEIWDTVTRRQFFWGHLMLNFLPIVMFGCVSFWYWVVYSILDGINVAASVFKSKRPQRLAGNGYMPMPLEKS